MYSFQNNILDQRIRQTDGKFTLYCKQKQINRTFVLAAVRRKKLVQVHQSARAPLSARVIALKYLEFHVRSKIYVYKIQSFSSSTHAKFSFRIK